MISWDCFDTLVARRFFEPTSIFDEVGKRLNIPNFKVEMRDRRPGDLEVSVLDNVSRYMREKYIMEEILKYDKIL